MEKRFRKIVAGVSAAALAVTTMLSNVWAEELPKYEKPYNIRNFLTDYQYFVEGDLVGVGGCHTIGGVVAGKISLGTNFGDAQYLPSFTKFFDTTSSGTLASADKNGMPSTKILYYLNTNAASLDQRFIKDIEYMDIDRAFKTIRHQSNQWREDGLRITLENAVIEDKALWTYSLKVLNIELSPDSSSNITIADEVIDKIDAINLKGVTNSDFLKNEYVISFDTSDDVLFSPDLNKKAQDKKNIYHLLNGEPASNNAGIKSVSSDVELYANGMKLIFNFPDVVNLQISFNGGHIVAPNANLKILGGNFEGNIIAKSVFTDSEAHYYPYYDPRVPEQYDPNEPTIPGDDDEDPITDDNSGDSEPSDSEPSDSEPNNSEPGESKPGESKPSDSEPSDSEPIESKPIDSKPSSEKPEASTPPASTPIPTAPNKPYYPPYEDTEQETTAPETTAVETTPAETTAPETTVFETDVPEITSVQTPKVTFVDIDPETEETTSETSKTIASEAENGGDSGLAENEYETDANGNPIRPDETDTNGGNGVDGSSENPETGIENLIVLPIMLGAAATAFALSKKRKNSSK